MVLTLKSPYVAYASDVMAIFRSDKRQPGILAQSAIAVVVILVIQGEDWQPVGWQLDTDRMRLDDKARLMKGVCNWRRVEVSTSVAEIGIDIET